jgi:long-chain acyl-CoA synthetase
VAIAQAARVRFRRRRRCGSDDVATVLAHALQRPPTMSHFDSLVEMAEDSMQRFARRPFLGERRSGTWNWTSYAELDKLVAEVRGGLASLGVHAGDRVAIVSRNSVAWAAAAYATYGLGAAFVPMYEPQRPADWEFILRDCGAVAVFGRSPEIIAALDEMRPRLPALRHVIPIEGTDDPRSLDAMRRLGRAKPVDATHPDPDSVAGLVYTSGTTGKPKGVMLTHRNLASNVAAATAVFPVEATDRSVSFLPWAHVYGQVVELHILMSVGASTAFNDNIDRLIEDLAEVRPTILVAVPRIFNKIHASVRAQIASRPRVIRALFRAGLAASTRKRRGLRLSLGERLVRWLADRLAFAKIRARFGGRLRYAISASATLSPEVGEFIDALGIDVYEGYGLTETSPVVATNRPGARKLGSVGRAIPGVAIRIDETRGEVAGQGEIIVYGPNVMKGYHARPDEDAHAFTADGGLHTGDLGYVDTDGFLFITGRIKEQYKLENGKYVMPTPLEEQLALSPYIINVMLYGEARPYNVALVVIDEDKVRAWATEQGIPANGDVAHLPTVHDLIATELARLSVGFRSYERPRAFTLTAEPFTIANGMLTPTLKLKRRAVQARYGAALTALYEPEPAAVIAEPKAATVPAPVELAESPRFFV